MFDFHPTAWDKFFLETAISATGPSKDPDTQVGAVIVGADNAIRSTGTNGFPRGIADLPERLANREAKLELMVHAELNAIINAARIGVSTRGCTLYLAATDHTRHVWGGPPCIRCTVHIIQAGISRVVAFPQKKNSKWAADLNKARALLNEAGVELIEVNYNHGWRR